MRHVYAVVLEEIHLRCLWAERGFRLEGGGGSIKDEAVIPDGQNGRSPPPVGSNNFLTSFALDNYYSSISGQP